MSFRIVRFLSLRINPDKEDFNIFKAVNEIFRYIKQSSNHSTRQSTKKTLMDKISVSLASTQLSATPLTLLELKYCM